MKTQNNLDIGKREVFLIIALVVSLIMNGLVTWGAIGTIETYNALLEQYKIALERLVQIDSEYDWQTILNIANDKLGENNK